MQSDSVSSPVGPYQCPLLVWEVLESRDMAGFGRICLLRPVQGLAMETEHRNPAGLSPEASCKPSHPRPTAPVGEKRPRL